MSRFIRNVSLAAFLTIGVWSGVAATDDFEEYGEGQCMVQYRRGGDVVALCEEASKDDGCNKVNRERPSCIGYTKAVEPGSPSGCYYNYQQNQTYSNGWSCALYIPD